MSGNGNLLNAINELIDFVATYGIEDEIVTTWLNDEDVKDEKQQQHKKTFYRKKHMEFILRLQKTEESYEYCQTEQLRMQVLYWALCGLDLLQSLHHIINSNIKQEILTFIEECWIEKDGAGGFGGNIHHDVHLLNTLSAIQILCLLQSQHLLNNKREEIITFIASLQCNDGSFMGDKWGEIDTRFTYAALNALSILDGLNAIDVIKCKQYLIKCRNFDGGYGTKPGAESHSGMIFCCVASLAIINAYDVIDIDVLNWWLCERQVMKSVILDKRKDSLLNNGGLNGRPMKLPDVCYSWWCLSAMKICNKVSWINRKCLVQFILESQDEEGGISDRPGDVCDVYHTYFGIGGLSLLGLCKQYSLKEIDPIWALPRDVCRNINLYKRHPYADTNNNHN